MTIAQRIGQIAASAETTTRAEEFATLAKFIMASGGVSKAARAAEATSRDGNLGPRLARILKSGLLNDISRGSLQKTAATAGTLEAFADLQRHRSRLRQQPRQRFGVRRDPR